MLHIEVFTANRVSATFGRYALGIVWIGGLMPFLMRIRMLDDGVGWLLMTMALAWFGDTGAYFAGKSFGRTKLYPLISPNKTWEGFLGGFASTAVLGVLMVDYDWSLWSAVPVCV